MFHVFSLILGLMCRLGGPREGAERCDEVLEGEDQQDGLGEEGDGTSRQAFGRKTASFEANVS